MMNDANPSMANLFEQLGLPAEDSAIESFIDKHKGLDSSVHIEDAPFWSKSQATFIQSALDEDAEWAEIIDQLNNRLR